jgi:hypothetical protein
MLKRGSERGSCEADDFVGWDTEVNFKGWKQPVVYY